MRLPTLLLASAAVLAAADASFVLETHSPAPYTPAYLGNGELGCSTSPLGTAATRCFIAGLYDHAPGDVPRLALAPAWNEIDLYNGRAWLNQSRPGAVPLGGYHQTLDMYDGLLQTKYEWRDGDQSISIEVESFASRADPNLAAVRVSLTPLFGGTVRVRLPLRAWPAPKRYPLEELQTLTGEARTNQWAIWYPGRMIARLARSSLEPPPAHAGLLEMLSQAEGTGAVLGQAVAVAWPSEMTAQARTSHTGTEAAIELSFAARPGNTYVIFKYAALVPELGGGDPIAAAAGKARESARRGWTELAERNARAWRELWRSDIVAEGDPNLQRVIHSMLFYLLGSARAGSDFSIPPMGLATSGYYGHYFWDADTYMFPSLLLLDPELARTIVEFRWRTLEAARANARKNGYQGAMYPWEAGPDGAEVTPRFASQNALYENHVNGDVALAAWQYYLATADRGWLEREGFPIIRETAEFWVSRVRFDAPKHRYEIAGVVSVNESLIGVTNDPYTNAVAKKNLDLAVLVAKTLGRPANPKWEEVARKLWLPRTDMLLIDYPLEYPLARDQKLRLAQQALARPPRGAMMGVEFYPILGVEIGAPRIIDALLPRTWRPYVRPPFNVLPETPTNNNINFITGAGAFLQQFLFGYSGLRLSEEGLSQRYRPLLPDSVSRLILKGVTVRGHRRDIAVENGRVE